MLRTPRTPHALLAVALAAGLLLAAPQAQADMKDGRITFEVATEPADLAPGGSGVLVVKGVLFEKLHIYGPGDEQAMTWKALDAPGVTYDLDALEISGTHMVKGEYDDEARPAWEGSFTVRVPVTLAADVASGTKLGLAFTYNGCLSDGICYPRIKDHEAALVLAGGAPAKPKVTPGDAIEEEGGVQVAVTETDGSGTVTVSFVPTFGWHFYGPGSTDGVPVDVTPVESEGITWGEVNLPPADKITMTYTATVAFTRAAEAGSMRLKVEWAGCEGDDTGGRCNPPRAQTFTVTWPGAKGPDADEPPPVAAPATPEKGAVLFPVIEGGELGGDEQQGTTFWQFLVIFAAGLGLAFTPCVLPIIPITVSVISGGNPDIPRQRLAGLLGIYVLGLCLTFATMGVIAAQTGGAMSDLFAMPGVQWGIVILFLVLGFGMYGVYELQAPAWLTRLQGGAQKRQGSVLGAFLFGCLGAIIASPCTGPAIAFLLIETAKEGNAVLGFSKFFILGLGMGAVLFAAGSLNFMMRPGPWMTWVRYTFGILIVGVAMYYLRNYNLVGDVVWWIAGGLVCAAAAAGIVWHLHKREMEEIKPATVRGIKVALLTALAIGAVAWYTRVPDDLLSWTYAKDPQHLQQLVAESTGKGKPVVVDFWGDWCTNCKVYDKRIATEPELRKRFEKLTRIKVDLSEDTVRWPMRHALGVEESGAPVLVFLDRKGRIRRKADLVGLEESEDVAAKVDLVLRSAEPTETGGR